MPKRLRGLVGEPLHQHRRFRPPGAAIDADRRGVLGTALQRDIDIRHTHTAPADMRAAFLPGTAALYGSQCPSG